MRRISSEKVEKYRKISDKYFSECDRENCDGIVKPYTLAGLLCVLGISREQFYSMRESRAGAKFVNYVLLKIEAFIQENALSGKLVSKAASEYLRDSSPCEVSPDEGGGEILITLSEEAEGLAT